MVKCHSERREESLFPSPFGERSFEIPLRQLADRNDRGCYWKDSSKAFYEKLGNVSVNVAWSDTDALLCREKLGVNRVEITHPPGPSRRGKFIFYFFHR